MQQIRYELEQDVVMIGSTALCARAFRIEVDHV